MPLIETALLVVEVMRKLAEAAKNATASAETVRGWCTGTTIGSSQVNEMLGKLERIDAKVQKLADHVYYSPGAEQVSSLGTVGNGSIAEGHVKDILIPISKALKADTLSTRVVSIPEKMRMALQTPSNVLVDVRPLSSVRRPPRRDMVPVLFMDNGTRFVGWQTPGAMPLLFGCEFVAAPRKLREEPFELLRLPAVGDGFCFGDDSDDYNRSNLPKSFRRQSLNERVLSGLTPESLRQLPLSGINESRVTNPDGVVIITKTHLIYQNPNSPQTSGTVPLSLLRWCITGGPCSHRIKIAFLGRVIELRFESDDKGRLFMETLKAARASAEQSTAI